MNREVVLEKLDRLLGFHHHDDSGICDLYTATHRVRLTKVDKQAVISFLRGSAQWHWEVDLINPWSYEVIFENEADAVLTYLKFA